MRKILLVVLSLLAIKTYGNDLKLSNSTIYQEEGIWYTILSLKWENSWKNKVNNDAVWVFFKLNKDGDGYNHIKISDTDHEIISSNTGIEIDVPSDRIGFFVKPSSTYRGNIEVTLKISLDSNEFSDINNIYDSDFKAHGIEMVYIPKGKVILGDPDKASLKFGAFYMSDDDGDYKGLFSINSETQIIEIGGNDGDLFYSTNNNYQGDQKGTLSSLFPKGVKAFYIMKYEPTEGQYVDFLNSLTESQTHNRVNFGGKDYYMNRGSIFIEQGLYASTTSNSSCNYMSWDDGIAYADWAGLRPLTEFEYTKASRGSGIPIPHEFPWGTNSKYKIQRKINENGQFYMFNGWDESKLNEDTKSIFGASNYWVMDLAGSLWERVITIGHPKGRSFQGTHGDGILSNHGFATNEDWPNGIDAKGIGFRGGGFYEPGRGYNEYNPYSPIAYRQYGAYSGGQRTKAYGARFCRTED